MFSKKMYIKGYNESKKLRDINLDTYKPKRGGCIPYLIAESDIYFCVGMDSKFKELTDFGGGISYKKNKDENFKNGALREFREETLGVFDSVDMSNIDNSVVVCSDSSSIIFIPVKVDMNKIVNEFNKRINKAKNSEISSIIWLDIKNFNEMLRDRDSNFYKVTRFTLLHSDDFYSLLRNE